MVKKEKTEKVNIIKEYDLDSLRHKLNTDFFITDIVIFHSKYSKVTWEELTEEYQTAYETFLSSGVQLNLVNAFQVDFFQKMENIPERQTTKIPKHGMDLDFYEIYDYQENYLHPLIENIFKQMIPETKEASKIIYIVVATFNLIIHWFEKDENNHWVKIESATSALSFPPYAYADRIPKHLRGIILFQNSIKTRKIMAHELGHKLINVSHEGLDKYPAGSGKDIPGLMGYGKSSEIFSGSKGRWHKERLQKSPFLYKLKNGKKVWNPDYVKGGVYNDPIYGELIVDPNCP